MWRSGKAVYTAVKRALMLGMAAILLLPFAHGAEIVTLRSGFTIVCTSREALSAEILRLYLPGSTAAGANYMDVTVRSVANVEAAPDLPAPTAAAPAASAQSGLPGILQRSGAAHNVSVALLSSVIQAESNGNPHATSRAGARGLMQLMPATAVQLGVRQSFEPADNVNGGSAYLDQLLTRYHEDVALALAAYNAGPGAVDRYHGMPPFRETRLYVARVLREFNRRVRQQTGAGMPAMITTRVSSGAGQ